MTDETTTEQLVEIEGQTDTVQVREGRWRKRSGVEVSVSAMPRDHDDFTEAFPWWDGHETTWTQSGHLLSSGECPADLVEYLGPIEPDKTQELPTKTQELPDKTQELQAEYTPPEGWRVLAVGEVLREGDVIVHKHDAMYATARAGGWVGSNQRYIRPIEPEPQPEPVQVREGRWRTRSGEEKNIRACEPLKGAYCVWPWTDGFMTFQDNGLHQGSRESPNDLVEYLGPIEPKAEPVPAVQGGLVRDVTHLLEESGVLDSAKAEQRIEELRSEVSYVQRLLGTERKRVAQLEELVGSLRTINETQEKAFTAAGEENTALRNQLAAVKAELASVAADRQRLQIELDAAQQVPQAIADRFEEGWNQGTARAVETVLEWLQPIRAVDHLNLSNETLQHLPQIMRHLTGLDSHAID